jgi:hypothetical protein
MARLPMTKDRIRVAFAMRYAGGARHDMHACMHARDCLGSCRCRGERIEGTVPSAACVPNPTWLTQ